MKNRLQAAYGLPPEEWLDFDPTGSRPARGRLAAATANPLASRAAVEMLRRGGAAVDAAIAAQAVLNVVEPNASGIGGGALLLVAEAGTVRAFDGLSAAPARVPDRLETDFDGRTVPADRAAYGGRTVGVPGAPRAMQMAHAACGRLPWADLFAPAIALAEQGFPLAPYLLRALHENPWMRDDPFTRATYCLGADLPPPTGTMLRNPALAHTLRAIAEGGADALYAGPLAAGIVAAVQGDSFAGALTEADLAEYRAVERAPVRFALGAMTVAAGPLPAFGGTAVGQIVGMLARLGLTGLNTDLSADEVHLLAEAGRAAFADRTVYADPACMEVDPSQLLAAATLDARAALLDRARRTDRIRPSLAPPEGASQTSHLCAADERGQMVSMTTTINQNFGSRIAVAGFYLNNVLTNFAADPLERGRRVPNAMAPLKRPRTTISPCIVLDLAARPLAAFGAGGGYRIIGTVANALLRFAGGLRDPQAILSAPHALNWNGATETEPPSPATRRTCSPVATTSSPAASTGPPRRCWSRRRATPPPATPAATAPAWPPRRQQAADRPIGSAGCPPGGRLQAERRLQVTFGDADARPLAEVEHAVEAVAGTVLLRRRNLVRRDGERRVRSAPLGVDRIKRLL